MAAPSEITLKNLNGQFVMNSSISDSGDPILKLQGVNFFFRKILNMVAVTVVFKEWVDESGITHVVIENKPSSGLPANVEDRTLNGEPNKFAHTLFGNVSVRTKWQSVKELNDIDEYLAKGFEDGTEDLIYSETEHVDQDLITHQAFGFQEINGTRHHTRHIVVKKGEEVVRATLAYDYLGPRDEQ
ncbi:hypothetical protein N7456_012681 [Penicillium angulare]|uniref:Uncharacterized protein n=1 Tax=Penicillium angulare TaxID=116970 RepID=A0A9W9EK47_9EURO|nr:hypothetical protein N7456_012681 [Penicillium angulare]